MAGPKLFVITEFDCSYNDLENNKKNCIDKKDKKNSKKEWLNYYRISFAITQNCR
jgi:hypothetical protein